MNENTEKYYSIGFDIGFSNTPNESGEGESDLTQKMKSNFEVYKAEMNHLNEEVETNFDKIKTALENINQSLPEVLNKIKQESEGVLNPITNTAIIKVSEKNQNKYFSHPPFVGLLLLAVGLLSMFGGTLLLPEVLLEEIAFSFENKVLATFWIYLGVAGINSYVVIKAFYKNAKLRDAYLFACLFVLIVGLLLPLFGLPTEAVRVVLFVVTVQTFSLTFIGVHILYFYLKIRFNIVKRLSSIQKDAEILDIAINEGFVKAIRDYKERQFIERYETLHSKINAFEEGFEVGKIKKEEMERITKELESL